MGLFRRSAPGPAETIPAFWSWWSATGADTCSAAIADKAPERLGAEMSRRIHEVDPDLAWELSKGQLSAHKLVVTAEGNPALRQVARRWLLAAPPADETWSFDDHRGPVDQPEGMALQGGPGSPSIAFSDVSLTARKAGTRLDVTIHHPAFPDLPVDARLRVAFLALDAALGENDTELWIGEIDTAEHAPLDGFGLRALRSLVDDLRRKALDDDGRPGWAVLKGQGADGPVVALARSPLHPLFGPVFTRHVAAQVPYVAQTDAGLPAPDSLDDLRVLEDGLEAALASDGLLVAHESSTGTRLFHCYVDPESGAVDRLTTALGAWAGGRVRIDVTDADPGWERVRHLRL